MASDLNDIEQALQTYFDGMYEGDTVKLGSVFHEVAHLFGVADGKLTDWSREYWFDLVRNRKSPQLQDLKRHDWVVQIDRASPTVAFAKVHCQIPPRYFTDYLTLLKVDGRWQVIAKAYHTVTKEG